MSKEVVAAAEVIRLVRCPKCGKVLPEIANIPVYQCGSCHTTLQAKSRGGSGKASEINETHSTRLRSEFPNGNSAEGPKALARKDPSCVEGSTGNAQKVHEDDVCSQQESKQNGASDSFYSDDKHQRSNGGGSCEQTDEGIVSPEGCFGGHEQEIDSVQSLELAPDERGHESAAAQNSGQTLGMPDKHKPLCDVRFEKREARTRSDGSLGRIYHSGSTSSGELLHRPRPSRGTCSPHSVSPRKPISNPVLSNSLSHRSEATDRGSMKPSWSSGGHSEVNGMETGLNGRGLREGFVGSVQSNGKTMGKQVDDCCAEHDLSNELESEIDDPMDQRMLNEFELQSGSRNMNTIWSRNQTKSTQIDPQFQRRERNGDWQKQSHYKLHSLARDRSLESNPGLRVMNSLQSTHSIQTSLHHRQRTPPTRGRRPYLSSNMPLESGRSDFYMYSEGLKQINQNYDNEDFDYIGNIPQVDEADIQILQKRNELLQKLDELRAQLSKSCQLPYSSTQQSQHKIGRAPMTPKPRQGMMEIDPYKNNGHGSVFIPTANDVDTISWDDYSDGSMQSSGQLGYAAQLQCVPREGQVQMHLEREPLHGTMDKEEIENGFASSTQDYAHRRSTVHPHRITQVSRSGELGLKHPHRTYHVSHPSVNAEQHACSCSSHFVQHQGGCCQHSYQDQHPFHVPLHVSPTVCCHQQVHNATNHVYFPSSYPMPVQVQATLGHQLTHQYHESVDVQRSKAKEAELILHKEKKYAEEPVPGKQRNLPCLPFAGGAPFVLCDNCLQLLLLPRNLSPAMKKKHKLRCGTCSSVFEFTVRSRRQFITNMKHTDYPPKSTQEPPCEFHDLRNLADKHTTGTSSGIQNKFINERNFSDTRHSHIDDYHAPISKSHFANGKQDFLPLVATVQNTVLKSQCLSSNVPLPMARENEKCQDFPEQRVNGQNYYSLQNDLHDMRISEARDNSNKAEGSSEIEIASPVAGSPLHELFGYSSPLDMINKCGPEKTNGVRYKRSVDLGKYKHSENAYGLTHSKMANKPELSFSLPDMHPGFGTSINMAEREHQEHLSRESGRSWNTSIKGFLKKGIKDLRKGNQGLEAVRSNVSVNGRSIPDTSVKKAEEYAGPIQPGNYWYDYEAGFWGLMGEPCLGIIPPFIEDFHYPMPRDCAGGKSRILVNGRELHQKDLDLLAARGLPTTKDKSYHVEISGRVVDKATNTELKSLGKLAPTLEKIGRGYGMRAPRKRS